MLVRGKELIIGSWKDYLRESFRFALLSFVITVALIILCSALGVFFGLLFRNIAGIQALQDLMASLRGWVNANFY
jgi:hypothetical protein